MANKVTNLTLPSGEKVEIQDLHALTLDENTTISGAFDFGKITGAGNYNVPINALNAPSSVSVTTGTLKVLYDHDKPIQIYLHRVTNQIFVRSLGDNGSWTSWVELTSVTSLASKISNVDSRVTNEVSARISADSDLQNAINDEKSARQTADINIQSSISTLQTDIKNYWKTIYPIGSIYMSFSNTNPTQLFGGSWNKLSNSFLVGAGDKYAVADTGGEETHTLTIDELPSHDHTAGRYDGYEIYNDTVLKTASSQTGTFQAVKINTASTNQSSHIKTNTTGGNQAHNNLPPYIAVNMWRRIG